MTKRRIVTADEYDAFAEGGRWRKYYFWQRGELRKLKRSVHKRERQDGRKEIVKEW